MPKPAAPAANITLVSADGHKRAVTRQIAEMSALIKEMLVAEGEEGHDDAQEIPLPNIHSKVILDKVVEFCTHHVNDPLPEIEKPLKAGTLAEVTAAWDAEFMALDQDTSFSMILAANYLDIPSLLDLSCQMKGKTTEQIRKDFNIVNDFTPEEEEKVREETKWCDETAANA